VIRAKKLWEKLRAKVGAPAFETCTVIFLGDYCDPGPDAKGLIDWLILLKYDDPMTHALSLCTSSHSCQRSVSGKMEHF